MAAVTQTINSYLGGVSRQTDKKKLPGQVRECLNAYPDPTFGLRKRPGFKFIKNIHTSSDASSPDLADAKWFFIKRDDAEQYIGNITNTGLRVWNKAGTECTVHDDTYTLTITGDGGNGVTTQRNLPVTNVSSSGSSMTVNIIDSGKPSTLSITAGGTGYSNASGVATTGGTGTGLLVDITQGSGIVTGATVGTAGTGYTVGDVVTVSGGGGNCTLTITGMDGAASVYVCTQGTNYVQTNTLKVAAADHTGDADLAFTLTTKPTDHYLDTTRDKYDVLTVQDTTIITNRTKKITAITAPTYVLNSTGRVIIKQVDYSSVYNLKIITGGSTYDIKDIDGVAGGSSLHPFVTRNDDSYTSGAATFEKLNVDEILTELKTRLDSVSISGHVLTTVKLDATLELELKTSGGTHVAFEIISEDERGGANMMAYTQQVPVVSDLPAQSIDGRIVKVINSAQVSDAYWSKFIADDGASGTGYWEETVAPNVSTGMNATTLPHELKNTAANVFILQQGVWTGRTVGDTVTNPDPSFVGSTIQQTFFHNNRFGVLTEDNVSMSQSADFFNFYYATALTTTDADPIDINTSSIRPATLHAILPTAQGLILFSKHEQFILFADAKILTPASTIIRGISNYEMDENMRPVDVGTNITFVSKTPSYTRVFNMITRGSDENPMVEDVGKVVSEWIPDTVNNLIASPQNSLVAMHGTLDDTLYIYKTYIVGDRRLMQSWVKWDLPGNIQHASIDSDTLWTVIEYNGKYVLISASLTQTPEEKIIITSEGQQVNPHMDMYGAISSMTYDSTNKLTKCYLPTGMRDNTTLTPVLVIAGNGTTNFEGVTESGFTITPDRPTGQTHATSSPYFEVPGKDLTTLTATDIIVGYKYNYDVELPKTFYKLNPEGSIVDYTASLIVSRMKFAVGLSSVCGFKLKSKGRHTPYEEFTGIGTVISSTLVANGTGGGPQGDHTVKNVATSTNGSGTGMTVDVTMVGDALGTVDTISTADAARPAATYIIGADDYTTDGSGSGATFSIAINGSGAATITITAIGKGYVVDETFTVPDSKLGSGGGANLTFDVATVIGVATAVAVNTEGAGYANGNTVTIAKALLGGTTHDVTATITTVGETDFPFNLDYLDVNDLKVKVNGTANTGYSVVNDTDRDEKKLLQFTTPPGEGDTILLYTDNWYTIQPVQDSNQYLADDVPLTEETIFTLPIHQKSENFNVRVFSNSPFPVSLSSMMWEGHYSPRYYRRT